MRVHKSTNSRPVFFTIFVVAICLFGISTANTQAAVITVTGNGDNIAVDGQCTLREAITAANTDAAANDCVAGTGADTIAFSVTGEIVLSSPGILLVTSNMTISGPGAGILTVRPDASGAPFRIFAVSSGTTVTISGLKVTGGGNDGFAGGISNFGTLTLSNMTVSGNTGHGVHSRGTLTVENSTISDNSVVGVYVTLGTATINNSTLTGNQGSGITNDGTLTLNNSIVRNNFSSSFGGGISCGGPTTINNSTLSGNTATTGGGIYTQGILTINHSTISDNTSENGGGIFSHAAGNLTITESTLSGNNAGLGGGLFTMGSMTMDQSTVSGNSAAYGAGIYALSGTSTLSNITVSGNFASTSGGAIYFQAGSSTIRNSTIYSNPAIYGGGLFNNGSQLEIVSTLISGNYAPAGCSDVYGNIVANYSLIHDNGCATLSGSNNLTGTDIDSLLGPLAYNGGPTKTHALLPGSPAIDAGSNPLALTTDQRGANFDRVVGLSADIGAFEVQPTCAGISFSPPTNFVGGNGPLAVASADLNGDGDADLAVTNYQDDQLVILIGNGTGGFSPPVIYLTGEGPRGVTVADINGDTYLDLAVANQRSNNLSILLGNGNGTFAPQVVYPAGEGPTSIVQADFNGDFVLDLVTANYLSDDVTVLLGNGIGGFLPAASFASTTRPVSLTAADFNSDGKTDLATANTTSGNVGILLGDGAGSFAAPVYFPIAAGARWLASGDFDEDGKIDLVVANGSSSVSILLGNDAAGFSAPVPYLVASSPGFVEIGDLNSDGNLDVMTVNSASDNVSVLLGNGTGSFSAAGNYAVGDFPGTLGIGDFNRDGRLDLAITLSISDTVSVLLNNCTTNAPPTAADDSYAVNEDMSLNVPAAGVVTNDTDGENDPLAAIKLTEPANGGVAFNADGSFIYTPNANFNGIDSFTYKANDGSLDSNIATVTIAVNAVNDAPQVSATPKTQSSVQYSDAISTVTIDASDVETPPASLAIAFSYSKDGGASQPNLPAGMTQGGTGGAWTVSGKANVPAGSYVITASVTDAGDSPSPPITSTDTFTIVVTRENAVAVPRLSNPVAMQVGSGGTATGTTGEFCFDFAEVADGSPGNISLIDSASVQINAVGGGSVSSITPSWITFSSVGPPVACVLLHLAGTAPNVFEVTLNIGGAYYSGSGTTAFLVYDPSAGFASGGGWIINPNTGYRANYGVNVKYLKNGNAQGSILYIEHRPDGDYKFKSTSLNSSGGFAIVPITGGSEAQIAGKGNYGLNGVFTGNYSFIARVIDKGNPGTTDQFGLKLITPNGQVMNEFTFSPQFLGGGNNQVPKK